MFIDQEKCLGCTRCFAYCPMRAISLGTNKKATIDLDKCVECNICFRAKVCPAGALAIKELSWPRQVRTVFSDPLLPHGTTGVPGRGTEEMKTNDVTHRFKPGFVGMAIEMGRPGTGAYFYDIEKVAMAVARHHVKFEPNNPLTSLMADPVTGRMNPEVLQEKVLSGIIEFIVPIQDAKEILLTIKAVAKEISTVFSLDICSPVTPDDKIAYEDVLREAGFTPRPNGKTNIGLGYAKKG